MNTDFKSLEGIRVQTCGQNIIPERRENCKKSLCLKDELENYSRSRLWVAIAGVVTVAVIVIVVILVVALVVIIVAICSLQNPHILGVIKFFYLCCFPTCLRKQQTKIAINLEIKNQI